MPTDGGGGGGGRWKGWKTKSKGRKGSLPAAGGGVHGGGGGVPLHRRRPARPRGGGGALARNRPLPRRRGRTLTPFPDFFPINVFFLIVLIISFVLYVPTYTR